MFKREKPLSLTENAKQFFWPSMGWKRTIVYIKHRLLRIADSTHRIALGLAIGMAVSFTPLLGTHFLQAGLIAYLLRGNVIAAMIGTFIGNPWTFPFFWWAGFSSGALLFSILGFDRANQMPQHLSLDVLLHDPMTLFLPWMLGGYVLCALCIPTTYFFFYFLVDSARKARDKAKMARIKQVSTEVTGHKPL